MWPFSGNILFSLLCFLLGEQSCHTVLFPLSKQWKIIKVSSNKGLSHLGHLSLCALLKEYKKGLFFLYSLHLVFYEIVG